LIWLPCVGLGVSLLLFVEKLRVVMSIDVEKEADAFVVTDGRADEQTQELILLVVLSCTMGIAECG